MKTASNRDVRHHFSRVLEWVANGEQVDITHRRRSVARLVPVPGRKAGRRRMPDVTARLQKVFGKKVIPDWKVAKIMEANRSAY
jgi:antitoxin (DNA-binding transcriptional repressor) of toxin-antitoxin stability system